MCNLLGYEVLDTVQKSQSMKEKISKLEFNKIKNTCSVEDI